ncbi:hypothetical protein SsS58_08151 [Streptomyces scabiei]|uniref:Uncharacterized protein n=1 Tax=Streptomyces scabiei TaxID=1930 RepID=A0A100JXX0_STRSC|nr:hypothetical protein SsS58_08151 [Streptomyces scabiei]
MGWAFSGPRGRAFQATGGCCDGCDQAFAVRRCAGGVAGRARAGRSGRGGPRRVCRPAHRAVAVLGRRDQGRSRRDHAGRAPGVREGRGGPAPGHRDVAPGPVPARGPRPEGQVHRRGRYGPAGPGRGAARPPRRPHRPAATRPDERSQGCGPLRRPHPDVRADREQGRQARTPGRQNADRQGSGRRRPHPCRRHRPGGEQGEAVRHDLARHQRPAGRREAGWRPGRHHRRRTRRVQQRHLDRVLDVSPPRPAAARLRDRDPAVQGTGGRGPPRGASRPGRRRTRADSTGARGARRARRRQRHPWRRWAPGCRCPRRRSCRG